MFIQKCPTVARSCTLYPYYGIAWLCKCSLPQPDSFRSNTYRSVLECVSHRGWKRGGEKKQRGKEAGQFYINLFNNWYSKMLEGTAKETFTHVFMGTLPKAVSIMIYILENCEIFPLYYWRNLLSPHCHIDCSLVLLESDNNFPKTCSLNNRLHFVTQFPTT